jgi:hypothetical protein
MDAPANALFAIPGTGSFFGADFRPINRSFPYHILGPYTARGARDGAAITASAGTSINFLAHFSVTGL